MAPKKEGRDYSVSQYWAAVVMKEQPMKVVPVRKRRRTPDERTSKRVLADLKTLLDFEPPLETDTVKSGESETSATDE